ncbi:dihydrodipicolinate synthase family protein [Actinopolymorpha alba]|uniref:dihydrodipicolinate synthase family protein n=1 Tax=Actinopolymorpha alba TaxID=533267 RepID=UPI00036FE8D9|nr:dihydrodipicolinate synthase family protein [Actinopolymorpha alba]
MAEPTFTGVGVALLTLFDEAGAVDVRGTIGHAKRLVDAGVRAVLVAGTTGEAETLTEPEREDLIAAARQELPKDITVIAGASGSWPRAAGARAVTARKAGADAVLVSPARGGVDTRVLYGAVAEAVGDASRVIGYHNPGPLGVPGIEVEALADLPIGAIKDSSADPARLLQELGSWNGRIYVGSAAILSFAGPLGAAGALLAFANAEPEACIQAFAGHVGAQRFLTDLVEAVRKGGMRALKEATAAKYGTSTVRRSALS